MANIIKLKQSNQVGKIPLVSDLVLGEPALNTTDGRLYIKQSVGGVESIVDIGNNQAIADLTSDLADEITNRIADVDAEEARAGAAESALDGRVIRTSKPFMWLRMEMTRPQTVGSISRTPHCLRQWLQLVMLQQPSDTSLR